MDCARGELIWVCESDDFCEHNFLEHIVVHFKDLSVNLGFGRIQYVTSDGQLFPGLDDYREAAENGIWGKALYRPAHRWFCRGFGVSNVIPNAGGAVWRNQKLLGRRFGKKLRQLKSSPTGLFIAMPRREGGSFTSRGLYHIFASMGVTFRFQERILIIQSICG